MILIYVTGFMKCFRSSVQQIAEQTVTHKVVGGFFGNTILHQTDYEALKRFSMNACFYMSDCYVTKLAGILQVSAYLLLQFIALTLELSFVDVFNRSYYQPGRCSYQPTYSSSVF